MKPLKSVKLRQSAKDQNCTMNVATVCNGNSETTVLAHINTEGSAIGAKCDDYSAAFACSDCHRWLDERLGTEEDRLFYSRRAMVRTWSVWRQLGLVAIK